MARILVTEPIADQPVTLQGTMEMLCSSPSNTCGSFGVVPETVRHAPATAHCVLPAGVTRAAAESGSRMPIGRVAIGHAARK